MDPVTLRSLERILVVMFGGLSIFLGYRLFLKMPNQKDAEGRVNLPGGASIYMTRIGPGGFFALFGALVISLSLRHSISYTETAASVTNELKKSSGIAAPAAASYTGFSAMAQSQDSNLDRIQVRSDIDFLATTLPALLRPDVSGERRKQFDLVLTRTKLAQIKAVWADHWGDFESFKQWVEHGAASPPPAGLIEPAALYRK